MDNLLKAQHFLESGNHTCVVCKEDSIYTTSQRGVAPLLNWLDDGVDLKGYSAADRVVGRGAAFLYCLLGVKEVYAKIYKNYIKLIFFYNLYFKIVKINTFNKAVSTKTNLIMSFEFFN